MIMDDYSRQLLLQDFADFVPDLSSFNAEHLKLVREKSIELAESRGLDTGLAEVIAVIHDIGRMKDDLDPFDHAESGASFIRSYYKDKKVRETENHSQCNPRAFKEGAGDHPIFGTAQGCRFICPFHRVHIPQAQGTAESGLSQRSPLQPAMDFQFQMERCPGGITFRTDEASGHQRCPRNQGSDPYPQVTDETLPL